jgi:hypothetical protein
MLPTRKSTAAAGIQSRRGPRTSQPISRTAANNGTERNRPAMKSPPIDTTYRRYNAIPAASATASGRR